MTQNILLHNFLTVFFIVFGSLLGSFSNVIILRMSSKTSVIFPPSSCPKCNHQLHALDLIPVLSWLFLRGKCRYCSQPISWQYPVVEAFISAIVGLSFYFNGLNLAFIAISSTSVIWFIASVILIRREVLTAGPYIWAAMYFIILSFPVNGTCPFLSFSAKLSPVIAILIATIATYRNNYESHNAWAGLSFIFLMALSPAFNRPAIVLLTLLAIAAALFKTKISLVEKVFALTQIAAIYARIVLRL